jgi:hypothetical protein
MPLGKTGFWFDNLGSIKKLIEKWKPPTYKSEGEYEKDLYKYLCDNTNGLEIVRQYGSSRVKVDLCVEKKVFIELKKDLNSTSKLQRLIGQLELYRKEKFGQIILILIGETDQNLEKHVKDTLSNFDDFDENSALIKI